MRLVDAEDIRDRACRSKVRYGRETAQAIPGQMKYDGSRSLSAYRCPFDGSHWHVGHLLSPEGMRSIAEAVRVLAGNGPGSDAGNIPKAERRAARRRLREPQSAPDVLPVRSPQPTGSEPLRSAERFSSVVREFSAGAARAREAISRFADVWEDVSNVRLRARTRHAVAEQRRRRS